MKNKITLAVAIVLFVIVVAQWLSNNQERMALWKCRAAHPDASVLYLPDVFVLEDVTLSEAINAFLDWYKSAEQPGKCWTSVVVRLDKEAVRRSLDLSGVPVIDAIPTIGAAFGMSVMFDGKYMVAGHDTSTRGVVVGAEEGLPPENYLNDFLATNVVAAVVGYEVSRQIAENIVLPFFSIDVSPDDDRISGVLFKVIAPSRYADKFFWLKYSNRNEEKFHGVNALYSFALSEDELFPHRAISVNSLFSMPAKIFIPSTRWVGVNPFFTTTNEVQAECEWIDERLSALASEMEHIRDQDTQTPEHIKIAMHESYKCDMEQIEARRQVLLNDANRIKENRELIDALFYQPPDDKETGVSEEDISDFWGL